MDLYLFEQINQLAFRCFCLDVIGIFLAKYLGYILIFSLLVLLAVKFKKYWRTVIESIIAAGIARLIIVNIIRLLWYRPRPFIENNFNPLLSHSDTSSFPSGHSSFYFAISTVIFLYNKKIGLLFFLASFLISLARIFTGIHWPTDILAGLIVGIFSGLLVYKISRKIS